MTPPEVELSRRARREKLLKERRRTRRRVWMWLLVSMCVLTPLALLSLLALPEPEPVARARTPEAASVPDPPEVQDDQAQGEVAADRAAPDPSAAELEDRLATVAEAYPAFFGVAVLDPSSGISVGMNPDERFLAASLGKLPALLALYKAADRGEVSLDSEITMLASDVQAYGTGVLQDYPVGYTITLRECARLLIQESDNTAWKMLTRYLGKSYVQAELYSIGAVSTSYWIPNYTTPNDTLLMLQKISDPSYTSPELSAEMLDHMTDTSFEDRLPAPLPDDARVAHKIGSYGDTFGDAGIVFPESSRDVREGYFIVVLATQTYEGTARAAMQDMSLTTYELLATPEDPADSSR